MRPVYARPDYLVCPNPLSADSYSICEYNCRYCFIRQMYHGLMKNTYKKGLIPTDLKELQRILKLAFGSRKESNNITILSLRKGLPVIIGRKCEPFCPSEAKYHNTRDMLEIFSDYGVKAFVECKGITTGYDDHFQINIEKFATGVLVSVMPATLEDQHKLEPDAPGTDERFYFAEKMKEIGLWVGLTSEPLLPTIADKPNVIESYAQRAHEIDVDHVNFGEYRSHISKLSQISLAKVGISLRDIMQGMKNWPLLGKLFMESLRYYDIKVSTPDWVTFGFDNDCIGCCGLDSFGYHKTNMQYAIQVIKKSKKVKLSNIIDIDMIPTKEIERITKQWNGDKKHYTLSDIKQVKKIGEDDHGNNIYGILQGNEKQKSLMEI